MALHVRRSGAREQGSRGAVVLIHGFPFDGSMWAPQLTALPPGWRGLAPDLRGFGRSDLDGGSDPGTGAADGAPVDDGSAAGVAGPAEAVLTMEGLADDVAALIERESVAPAVVCGLSMGGYVALALWRRRPELVRALVLADTRAEADTAEGRANRKRMAETARTSGSEAIARAMVPTLLSASTLESRRHVADQVAAMIQGTRPETLVAALEGMARRSDSTGLLGTVDVPALVVAGEADGLTPPAVARSLAEGLPRARLVVLPDAGHVSNLEQPAAFNEALRAFLDEL